MWNTQIMALLGDWFDGDLAAAFANFTCAHDLTPCHPLAPTHPHPCVVVCSIWTSLTTAIAFFYNPFINKDVRKVVLLSVLGIGMLGYIVSHCLKQRRKGDVATDENDGKKPLIEPF